MDYPAFLTLAADYDTTSVTLSPESITLVLCLMTVANDRNNWSDAGEPVSDSQWDEIEALVAQCEAELMP